jgi:YD repeat-containing protein
MKKVLSFLCLATAVGIGAAAHAADYPTMTFDATYDLSGSSTGKGTMRMVCDGKGHMLTETVTGGRKTTTISDYPAKMTTTLMEQGHMSIKTPMQDMTTKPSYDQDFSKRKDQKPLGAKVMDGHPCHGYESKDGTTTTDSWIGDDIKYLVHSESKYPQGSTVMALKTFSAAAPPPNTFAVPPGYKEMVIPH